MTRLTNPSPKRARKSVQQLLSQPEIRKPGGRLRNGELFSCTRSHWSYGGKRALMDPIECAEARIHQAWTSNEFSRPDTTLRCPRWHPLARYHVRPLKLLIDAISEQRFNIVSQDGDRFSIYWVILSTLFLPWQTIVGISLFLFIRRRFTVPPYWSMITIVSGIKCVTSLAVAAPFLLHQSSSLKEQGLNYRC